MGSSHPFAAPLDAQREGLRRVVVDGRQQAQERLAHGVLQTPEHAPREAERVAERAERPGDLERLSLIHI